MLRLAHAFLAARNHDFAIAIDDRLMAERDRAKPRTAKLVHPPGRHLDRNACIDGRLPGRILALARLKDLTEDDFRDVGHADARPLDGGGNRDPAEFVRRQARQSAIERANGRTRRADNDHLGTGFAHGLLPGAGLDGPENCMTPLLGNGPPGARDRPVTLFSVHRNAGLAQRNNTASQCQITGGKGPLRQVAVIDRKSGPAR